MAKNKLGTFDLFTLAMRNFETQDKELFTWNKNRIALSHALAMQLSKLLQEEGSPLSVDLCPNFSKSSKVLDPEIAVHDRKISRRVLAVVCRNDYLSETEQKGLLELKRKLKFELVMAVAFMPNKSYSLLYRAADDRVEYYHFDRNTMTMEMLKISNREKTRDKDQLTLNIGHRKK